MADIETHSQEAFAWVTEDGRLVTSSIRDGYGPAKRAFRRGRSKEITDKGQPVRVKITWKTFKITQNN